MLQPDFGHLRKSINWTIEPNDPMYNNDQIDHYSSVGESALKSIIASRMLANVGDPESILDFACANGRVTRWLKAAYPEADLHVADINSSWAEWSGKTFDATYWLSTPDLADVEAPQEYDQIWCGSLATHISPEQTANLLNKFKKWLKPNGIATVTMHGRQFVKFALVRSHAYFADPLTIEPILRDMAAVGFGYAPHPGQDHGISAATPDWLIRNVMEIGCRIITFSEHAWDGHQDVLSFQKTC
jgi:phospholipid N-methyltransferase